MIVSRASVRYLQPGFERECDWLFHTDRKDGDVAEEGTENEADEVVGANVDSKRTSERCPRRGMGIRPIDAAGER